MSHNIIYNANTTHNKYTQEGDNMTEALQVRSSELAARQQLTAEIYNDYINFLDTSEKTAQTYTRAIRQFFKYCNERGIDRPERADVLAFRDSLKATGHKATTIQSYITAVRLFFQWTSTAGLYPDIAQHVKGQKITRSHKKDALTSTQIKAVLAGIERETVQGKRDFAMLFLMTTGGLRTVEINRANIEDLRPLGDDMVLYVQGKGHTQKDDFVKVPAPVEKAIRDYLRERGEHDPAAPLFASLSRNSYGQRMTTRSVSGVVKKHLQAAGYDSDRLTAHSLRHTAVTLALLDGQELAQVKEFARHADISTTMIYNHAIDKAKNSCGESVLNAIT